MASLKQLLGCIGQSGEPLSVVKDFFGYHDSSGNAFVPAPPANPSSPNFTKVSVLDQVKLLQGTHFHLNIILVGHELFAATDWEKICFAIHMMRYIYGKVGLGVGRVHWGSISAAEAGALVTPDSAADCTELTNGWSAEPDGMDLFVCTDMRFAGRTGQPWANNPNNYNPGHTCDKDSNKHNTGSVANLSYGEQYVGNTFAHEIGHYFGLGHIEDEPDNFIGGEEGASNSSTGIHSFQGDFMKLHCFMVGGC